MYVAEYRALQANAMSEESLQSLIVAAARQLGWHVYHPYDSRRSTPGYPDLTLTRGGRLIFAELKSAKGRVRADQRRWLAELAAVAAQADGAVETFLWRPADWFAGTVMVELQRQARVAA
jgi:hypothetical protein